MMKKLGKPSVILTDCNSHPCPVGGRCVKLISYWLEIPVFSLAAERSFGFQNKIKTAMRSCLFKRKTQTWWQSPLQRSRSMLLITHERAHSLNPFEPGGKSEFTLGHSRSVQFNSAIFGQRFVHGLNLVKLHYSSACFYTMAQCFWWPLLLLCGKNHSSAQCGVLLSSYSRKSLRKIGKCRI